MEQLGPALVFLGYQVLEITERVAKTKGLVGHAKWRFRIRCYAMAAACVLAIAAALAPTGYFGPLSVRVRGLFIKHTKTGNPLVDSVAEHQPGSADAYVRYLNFPFYVAPVGFAIACAHFLRTKSAAALFLPLYAVVAYYFANRMVRLIIFLGPSRRACPASPSGTSWSRWREPRLVRGGGTRRRAKVKTPASKPGSKGGKGGKGGKGKASSSASETAALVDAIDQDRRACAPTVEQQARARRARRPALALLSLGSSRVASFWSYSHDIARGMSQPSVMFKGQLNDGRTIIVKDYVEAYHWLRDNTPEDARVMAWWDYGYQIAGIANRTSIADGNTWNHEHIANLARTMTATEEKAHRVIRHLADYVLVWSGGGADDMAKSPHLFRIGKSIGHDTGTVDMHEIQSKFGVDQYGRPTPLMAQSLLYKLVSFQGSVSNQRFEEVYTSRYRKVRIYKVVNVSDKSKRWAADPANRLCDAPGSWYCPGQYPPALAKFTGIIKPAYAMPAFHQQQQAVEAQRMADRAAAAAAAANAETEAEL